MLKNIAKPGHPDYILVGVVAVLIVLGILILASVSASLSVERFGTTYYFLNHQLLFGLIPGVLLAFLAFRINLASLKKWAPILLFFNLVLLAMVFLPKIGEGFGGATRWLNLGPISLQPSEFLKLTFILYLASWLSSRTLDQTTTRPPHPPAPHSVRSGPLKFSAEQAKKNFSQTLLAFLILIVVISLFLIFQPDISTLGIIGASVLLIYFLAETPLWHSLLTILAGLGGLLALIKLAPYRAARLLVFFQPEIDPMGIGYQIKQALIAVGSGGISGLGLGLGMFRQKLWLLPQSMSDSIFAIFAEEGGFIGSCILIFLFLIFLWRGFKIANARVREDKFSQLAALGLTIWICLQGFTNIGSMIGVLPLTGIPLPFISYGGSALISELIGVGILLNISRSR